jgi:hypothetical protein
MVDNLNDITRARRQDEWTMGEAECWDEGFIAGAQAERKLIAAEREAERAAWAAEEREMAMQAILDVGQAQGAYEDAARWEAEATRLRAALREIAAPGCPAGLDWRASMARLALGPPA